MVRILFTVSGLFALLLGVLLLFAPRLYLSLYVVNYSDEMAFAAQRLAPVVAALGGVLLLVRDAPPGPFARRFTSVTSCVWFGVAGTGIYHFATGTATFAILVAAALEIALGIAFVLAARHLS